MAKGVDINGLFGATSGQGTQNPRYGIIGKLIGANLNTTSDQPFIMNTGIGTYIIDFIQATNKSATPTLAAGGIYTAASKGGTAVVASGQVYTGLSAANIVVNLTLAVTTTRTESLFLSLTTANGSTCTCDMYVWGWVLK